MTPTNRLAGVEVAKHLQRSRDRRQIIRCSDVANYPATAAFSNSTYKIYAVHPYNKYKSNILDRLGWDGERVWAASGGCNGDSRPAAAAVFLDCRKGAPSEACNCLRATWCFRWVVSRVSGG